MEKKLCYMYVFEIVFLGHRWQNKHTNQSTLPIDSPLQVFHMILFLKMVQNIQHHIRYRQYKIVFEIVFQIHIVLSMHSKLHMLPIVSRQLLFHIV